MTRFVIFTVAGLAVASAAEPPRARMDVVSVPHFDRMTDAQLRRLNGRSITVSARLDSSTMEHEGFTLIECAGGDERTARTVWLVGDVQPPDDRPFRLTGRLQIIEHPPRAIGAEFYAGFTEYRIVNAAIK